MENKKEIKQVIETLVARLNNNYCTVADLAKKLKYSDHSYVSRKVKNLGLGLRIKNVTLLSPEEQETVIQSLKRRGSKFSSE